MLSLKPPVLVAQVGPRGTGHRDAYAGSGTKNTSNVSAGAAVNGGVNYLYKGWPVACTYDCQSGCFCKEGYFRNRRGKCVLGYRCFREITPYVRSFDE
ncbi:hypothetical protein MTO96_046400 [Rhipicephalus appendiculatus]